MAGCNITQEPCEYRIEVSWPFPEWGVPESVQAMTAAFPQICVCNSVEVVEIHQPVRIAVDHCERDRTAFHGQTLIYSAHDHERQVLGTVSVDGNVASRIASDDGDVREPAWSPFASSP